MKKQLDPDNMHGWLATVFSRRQQRRAIHAGVNDDDCAVMGWNHQLMIITTDFLNARPIATELHIGNSQTLGRLVVAANLSDLCGTGAEPQGLLIGATMPRGSSVKDFEQIMRGVRMEASRWNVPVVGGDTKLGESRALFGVAFGSAASLRNLFLKNAAKPGQIIWASGNLGSCTAAVIGLRRRDASSKWRRWAASSLTVPKLPLMKSRALSTARIGRAGTDISDGLGEDLNRLARASSVGVVIEAARIPIAQPARWLAQRIGVPDWSLAFGIGGDFQFVVTTSSRDHRIVSSLGFRAIGKTTSNRRLLLKLPNGMMVRLPTGGHRDARQTSFAAEAQLLVKEACNVQD